MTTVGEKSLVVLMVVVLLASVVGPVAAAAGTAGSSHENVSAQGSQSAYEQHDGQFVDVSDDVSVWERSVVLPFRVADGQTVATEVRHPSLYLSHASGEPPVHSYSLEVFDTDQQIELGFHSAIGAKSEQFDSEKVDLLAVQTDLRQSESAPRMEQLKELLTGSSDAQYEIAGTTTIDGDDDPLASFTYDVSSGFGAGDYAFFMVESGSVDVDDGSIADVSDAHVLGMDTAIVQSTHSTVEPAEDTVTAGESVDVEVDSNLGDDSTSHTAVLFDETDLVETTGGGDSAQRLTMEYDGDLSEIDDASAEDFTLHSTIGEAHGVASVEEDVSLFGSEIEAQQRRGAFEFTSLVDPFVTQFDLSDVETETETGDEILNVSATGVSGADHATTLEVGTLDNFTAGEYDLLHVAVNEDTGEVSTERTTVTVEDGSADDPGNGADPDPDPDPGNGADPDPDPGNGADPDPDPGNGADPDPDPGNGADPSPPGNSDGTPPFDVDADVEPLADENASSVGLPDVPANRTVEVELPDVVSTNATAVEAIAINVTENASDLEMLVNATATVPGEATPALTASDAIAYVEVTVDNESSVAYNDAEFTFTVAESTLEERDIQPEDVQLFRYSDEDGEWGQVPTEHEAGETYVATSPGFSVFAIGTQQSADLEVRNATVDDGEVETGETVEVTATVENAGEREEVVAVEFTADGEVVDTRNVALGPDETADVSFEHAFEEAGTYDLAVAGADAGTVEVEDGGEGTETDADDGGSGEPIEEGLLSPGLVLVVVLALILVTTGVIYYARRSE